MSLIRICLLCLVVPPVLWLMFHSHQRRCCFLAKAFCAALLVPAFCLTGFVMQESLRAANVLADALNSLSHTDLRKHAPLLRSTGG